MSEDLKRLDYDFDFICGWLNLIPWREGAFNVGAVDNIRLSENGNAIVTLRSGHQITLSQADLVELEATMKRCQEEAKARQKEAVKNQMLMQADASMTDEMKAKRKEQMRDDARMQMEVMAELQSGVQPGMIVGAAPTGKRFRQ